MHPLDRIAVPGFVECDGPALRAGGERGELISETECSCGERRQDCRREERAGEERSAHLLLHDDRVDETQAETSGSLRHQQARPTEIDDLAPHLGRDAGVVVLGHAPHVLVRSLGGEERAHRSAQRLLLG